MTLLMGTPMVGETDAGRVDDGPAGDSLGERRRGPERCSARRSSSSSPTLLVNVPPTGTNRGTTGKRGASVAPARPHWLPKAFCGMLFFVARRNRNRKVEVTVGDISSSRPGIAAGHSASPRLDAAPPPRREAPF